MKMAKASQTDIDRSLEMLSFLEMIETGYFPGEPDSDSEEWELFDRTNKNDLTRFYEAMMGFLNGPPSGLMRVIFGFATVCENEIFHPDFSYLEINPALFENVDPERPTDFNWLAEKACGALPEGFEIVISLENSCGSVDLITPDGQTINGYEDGVKLDQQVFNLLTMAKI